jgi:hypothetical protein
VIGAQLRRPDAVHSSIRRASIAEPERDADDQQNDPDKQQVGQPALARRFRPVIRRATPRRFDRRCATAVA